jgi:hypothetical protein
LGRDSSGSIVYIVDFGVANSEDEFEPGDCAPRFKFIPPLSKALLVNPDKLYKIWEYY